MRVGAILTIGMGGVSACGRHHEHRRLQRESAQVFFAEVAQSLEDWLGLVTLVE